MFPPMSTTTENARFQNETRERIEHAARRAQNRRPGLMSLIRRMRIDFPMRAARPTPPMAHARKQTSRA